MPPNGTSTAARLRRTALVLFAEQGYEATTVDDVAAAVGVTERTFFRHFRGKDEVLFAREDIYAEVLVQGVRDCIEALGRDAAIKGRDVAITAARAACLELAGVLEDDHEEHVLRAQLLRRVPDLQGRQLLKQQRWAEALLGELILQRLSPRAARIAVAVAMTTLQLAYDEWVEDAKSAGLRLLLVNAENDLTVAVVGQVDEWR